MFICFDVWILCIIVHPTCPTCTNRTKLNFQQHNMELYTGTCGHQIRGIATSAPESSTRVFCRHHSFRRIQMGPQHKTCILGTPYGNAFIMHWFSWAHSERNSFIEIIYCNSPTTVMEELDLGIQPCMCHSDCASCEIHT